ncbi:[NiFe] hydrogenase nickel incorporation-associated protein HypB [hydrothermal vent metagenome]|uniref:[NiFe] hydrogenase nickel incorporation-associated protein HypB n=1 Tax=hydrothermal vent metagenome TaxID=652676 RepID=A0A3B1C1Q5_9ZZZZ
MMARSVITIKKDILAKNDELADENRNRLKEAGILAMNLVSSPGAGKTSLLVKTLNDIGNKARFAVIEGDQETDNDAKKIEATGVPVTQINTISACHLDAAMMKKALDTLNLDSIDTLFIENVGNLVCPASYDLGEKIKVALMSVTEGEDKPLKYPKMFRVSSALIITKTDLLPYVDFDIAKATDYALKINPKLKVFKVSAKSGDGLLELYDFILSGANDLL